MHCSEMAAENYDVRFGDDVITLGGNSLGHGYQGATNMCLQPDFENLKFSETCIKCINALYDWCYMRIIHLSCAAANPSHLKPLGNP